MRHVRRKAFAQTSRAKRIVQARRGRAPRASDCGAMLSMLKVNARHLGKSQSKAVGLYELLKSKRFPALVGVTELGCGPEFDFGLFFAGTPMLSLYELRHETRTCSHSGGPITDEIVGGGVMLLVRRYLGVDIRSVQFDVPKDDQKFVDGHVGVWQLVPRVHSPPSPESIKSSSPVPHNRARPLKLDARRLRRVLIVSVLYAPPRHSQNWGRHRDAIQHAIRASEEAVRKLRRTRDAFHVVLAHLNAQDGGIDVPLRLQDGQSRVEEIKRHLAACHDGRFGRPMVSLTDDDSPFLRRHQCKRASKCTKDGRLFVDMFAAFGMVPLNGVSSARQPTTWRMCRECTDAGRRCTHGGKRTRARLRNVNDWILVPADSIVDALSCARGQVPDLQARRIDWDPQGSIDHAVTTAQVYMPFQTAESRAAAADEEQLVTRQRPRLLRLPYNLRERAAVLRVAKQQFRLLMSSSPLPSKVNELSKRIAEVLRLAHENALNEVAVQRAAGDGAVDLGAARSAFVRAQLALRGALRAHAQGGRTADQRQQVRVANKVARKALVHLKLLLERERAEAVRCAHLYAPKEMWLRFDELALTLGAKAREPCALLQRLNDHNGGLISTQRNTILRRLHEHRRGVFQIGTLTDACERKLTDSLYINSSLNAAEVQREPGMEPTASAYLSASDPLAPMAQIDARRGYERERLDTARLQSRVQPVLERIRAKRAQVAPHADALSRVIEMGELVEVIREIKDVGCGDDGVRAAVMRKFDEPELDEMLALMNEIRRTGVAPSDWSTIRCLLHFKKGDEYHVENYRGLGVGPCLAKLLSLIMSKRLMTFILATKAISVSQGGFLPERGTPEQVITLTETCRAAARGRSRLKTYLAFIDIRRAYDSVLHPVLWRLCAELGIDGRFLAMLQALYHNASAVLDVDGVQLPAVPLECGVLQGSPLSCLLFDIYIDPALRALEMDCEARAGAGRTLSGISLPRVGAMGTKPLCDAARQTFADRLTSLFFADDGVLFAHDLQTLQEMAAVLEQVLSDLGFAINTSKTECMVIPPLAAAKAEYETIKAEAVAFKLKIAGDVVGWVDQFRYLGTIVWWRLDWSLEWKHAQDRVANGLRLMCRAGMHRKGLSPAQLYRYASNKFLCYLDLPSKVSGAGGCRSSAPWAGNDGAITKALATIMCQYDAPRMALRGEFGVWDAQSRIDMLLLRQFAKLVSGSRDSTHFRAMCVSFESLSAAQRSTPETTDSRKGRLHNQPWAQQVLAAARRFKLEAPIGGVVFGNRFSDVCLLRLGLVGVSVTERDGARSCLVTEEVTAGGLIDRRIDGVTVDSTRLAALAARADVEKLRLGLVDLRAQHARWQLPEGTKFADALIWSPTLHDAAHTILKRIGNVRAQQVALDEQSRADQGHQHKQYAAVKRGVYFESYLNLPPRLATALFRTRSDSQPTEDNVRRKPHRPRKSEKELPRLNERLERACYQCDCIQGAPGVYPCETLLHVLLVCPAYADLRAAFRTELTQLVAEVHDTGVAGQIVMPDVSSDTVFAMLVRSATSCTSPVTTQMVLRNVTADRARAAPVYDHDARTAERTSSWLRAVSNAAKRRFEGAYQRFILRDGNEVGPDDEHRFLLCNRLIECIATFSSRIFSRRHVLLRTNAAFAARSRDPAPPLSPPRRQDPAS